MLEQNSEKIAHLGEIPLRNAEQYPHQIATVHRDRHLTWAEINERMNRLANALSAD